MMAATRYWLMKTEPTAYSIDDLKREGVTMWDGVRNYQARNFMRDDMKVGDMVLFYHSNVKPPAVVGIAEVVKEAYPDPTAFDKRDHHYDPKSRKDDPTWYLVDIKFVEKFADPVTLDDIKVEPACNDMMLVQKGSRLSVQPVAEKHYKKILNMAKTL